MEGLTGIGVGLVETPTGCCAAVTEGSRVARGKL